MEFLVRGLKFFIRGLEFLVRGFQLLAHLFEPDFIHAEFLFQIRDTLNAAFEIEARFLNEDAIFLFIQEDKQKRFSLFSQTE